MHYNSSATRKSEIGSAFKRQTSLLSAQSSERPRASSLRVSLTPKSSGKRISVGPLTSGIKSSYRKKSDSQKYADISQSQSKKKQVIVIAVNPPDLQKAVVNGNLPPLEENIQDYNSLGVESKSRKNSSISRKNSIPQISVGNRKKSIVRSSASLEKLRQATVKNMIEVDESSLQMNDEGVSFSLSSRIRRKTIVLDEKIKIPTENTVPSNNYAGLGRKFKNMSRIRNSIAVIQDSGDEPDLIKTPDTKSRIITSNEGLSKTKMDDGTQTSSAYSANVEDGSVKKFFAATVKKPSSRPDSKNLFKAPPGTYMGILVHPNLMRPPFPFPSKRQILFGPYENPLLEVEKTLCIHHLFHNLDYYYMPTDPIPKSLLDPKRFTYALEPIYNDKHIAKEALAMLPIKRYS